MKLSKLYTKTSKSVPADESANNARLLIQAGYIHKEMAGVYSYLPLGKIVLDKISQIIREEMNNINALEVQMSVLQPKDIWEKTDRWDDKKVDNWFKTKLNSGHELGIGLTHEEPIVDSLKGFVNSYKDLPVYIYQIQNKFRNELRAKSGLLRGREFLMKDLYSFSLDESSHKEFYEKVIKAYYKIYERLGIGKDTYRTYADGGIFSSDFSDEFQTLSEVGEDLIYLDEKNKIAINKEIYNPENLKKIGLKESDLKAHKAVEVGNTFSLGSKYTDSLDLYYTDKNGQRKSIIMGCYGIGVSRLMGIIAEKFSDEFGLVWPKVIAPYKVYLIAVGQDQKTLDKTQKLYDLLTQKNVDVIYDDRDMRIGEKFADADLLGIPIRAVISPKHGEQEVAVKQRSEKTEKTIKYIDLINLTK